MELNQDLYDMKQEIVPTSPKSTNNGAEKSRTIFAAIIVSVLFGTLSGVFGILIGANVLSYFPDSDIRDRVLFSSARNEQSIITQSPEIIDQLVSVYAGEPSINTVTPWLGNAVALTADGWFVMPTVVFDTKDANVQPVVELTNGVTAVVTESVEDRFTGMTFFHVDAESASVVSFPESKHLVAGQTVSVITEQRREPVLYERVVAGTPFTAPTQSVSDATDLPVLDSGSEAQALGSPVFYTGGNFAGIVIANGQIVPSQWIQGVLQSVLRTKKSARTTLDISSINADQLTVHERTEFGIPEHGLYIVHGDGLLFNGDVITVMNGVRVDANTNLRDSIQSKPVGSTLYCTVLRSGEELPVELVL